MSGDPASKNQLPAAGNMSPPIIPERHSSKRKAAESIEELQGQQKKLAKIIKESKQRLSRNSSYDAEYANFPKIEKWILIFEIATGWRTARSLASRLVKLSLKGKYPFKALSRVLLSKQERGTRPKLQSTPSKEKVPSIRRKGCFSNKLNA